MIPARLKSVARASLVLALWAIVVDASAEEPQFAADDLAFFEKKIRPVLVEHCQKCHSADAAQTNQLKAGLMLDSRAGLLKGGDSGPAVVPGNIEDSLLIDALRFESFQMPPKGKLPESVIADFVTWIQRGAADPRQPVPVLAQKKPRSINMEVERQYWCYQPVVSPQIPAVEFGIQHAPHNAIDTFVLTQLQAKSLVPSREADRATLVRRLYFDLLGIPPRPEELDEFLMDVAPDAYERLVEQLLASPRFGERWGRHWLDVARYAESLTLRGFVMPEAWRYRDYVIATFNADRSFADFMREQVSGDLLTASRMEDRRRNLIATSFLSLGNTNLEEQDKKQLRMDVVDEQLDAICKGFLAQTIGCARCHDHKFDPIPTRDYYALAGILRNSKTLEDSNVSKWLEFPLPVEPQWEEIYKRQETQVAATQSKIKTLKDAVKNLAKVAAKSTVPANVTAATTTSKDSAAKDSVVPHSGVALAKIFPGVVVDDSQAKLVGEWKKTQFVKTYIDEGYIQDLNKGKGEKTATFTPELPHTGKYEVRLAYTAHVNRAENVPITVFSADGEKQLHVNQKEPPPIDERFVSLGQYKFEKNGQSFVIISNEGTNGYVTIDAVQFLPVELLNAPNTPVLAAATTPATTPATSLTTPATTPPTDTSKSVASTVVKDSAANEIATAKSAEAVEMERLNREIKTLEKELTDTGPKRPMYMSVKEETKIEDTNIHVRGSVHNMGEKVSRGFLQAASFGERSSLSSNESGRRELGDWLASAENPLPARVMTNRIWHWLFGAGLVRTTDNFGTTGELPSHPELLDYLAHQFVADDWSMKNIVREIVLSRTYRQAFTVDPKNLAADPENRLLWRTNRRRLDAECLLDATLVVSGELRLEAPGKTYKPTLASDYNYKQDSPYRAVYWPSFRNSIPEYLEVFDMADPSTVVGRRNSSTVSPQALFMMNDDWLIRQSQQAAKSLLASADADDTVLIGQAYRATLGRRPTESEHQLALNYLQSTTEKQSASNRQQRWTQLFQALFASMDFRYVE